MNGHDEAMLELVAVLALGALPEAQAREVAQHLEACAVCRAEYALLRPAASAIGLEAEVASDAFDDVLDARLRKRIMHDVRGANGAAAAPAGRGFALTRSTLALAASVAIAIGAIVAAVGARGEATRAEEDLALVRAQLEQQQNLQEQEHEQLASLLAPDSRHWQIPGGEVVRSGDRLYIAMSDLPALPAGKTYQAWTLPAGSKTVKPSIPFTPGPGGITLIVLPESAAGIAAVAVSVEPQGGSKTPTTKPRFVRPLT